MGRDTIHIEDVVSTISGEYLLEFTSEYGIPEGLHPELPGPEDTIVDFLEGKQPGKNTPQCYTKPLDALKNWNNRFFWVDEKVFPTVMAWCTEMDLFNLISAPNPTKVETRTRPHAAHEVPLLTATASRVIEMEDPFSTSTSSETPSVMEKSPLDFSKNTATTEVVPELNLEKEITAKEPPDTRGGKSLAAIGLGPKPPSLMIVQQSVSNLDPLSSSKIAAVVADLDSENTSFTSMARSPGSIYQPGWGVTNSCRLDTLGACQDLVDHIAPLGYFSELCHLPNDDFLSQYNINLARKEAMGSQLRLRFEHEAKLLKKSVAQVARRDQRIQARENEIKNLEALLEAEADMKKATEAKNAKIVKELESLRAQFTDLQVSNDRLSQQVSTLQAQVMGEERIKAAFEEFKKYEDYEVEHRKAGRDLVDVEAYDPDANSKLVKALQDLK
ncbi:hypothetical protein Tco_1180113, partial [Tanacetum coccineum]